MSKTNQEVAREVIAGKWGVDNDRKNRLEEAGYNYYAVQSIVNALMRGDYVEENVTQEETNTSEIDSKTLVIDVDLEKYDKLMLVFSV